MVDVFGVVGVLAASQTVLLHHAFFGDPAVNEIAQNEDVNPKMASEKAAARATFVML